MKGANARPITKGAESMLHVLKPLPRSGEEMQTEGRGPPPTCSLARSLMPTSRTPHGSFSWQPHSPSIHAGPRKA